MAVSTHTRTPGRRQEDRLLYRLVFPMVMGLALGGALLFGYQLVVAHQQAADQRHLEDTASWSAETIAAAVEERRERVATLGRAEWVREALAGDSVPADALERLDRELPGALATGLVPATVDERDVGGFPALDYAALDLMWDFLQRGEAPPRAEIHLPGSGDAHLAMIEPVFGADDSTLLGFVRVAWPAGFLRDILQRAELRSGFLALMQGEGGIRDHRIVARGDTSVTTEAGAAVPVPETRLRVVWAPESAFLPMGPLSEVMLWSGFIACLLLLVACTWLRLKLPALRLRLQARRDSREPTMAELPRQRAEDTATSQRSAATKRASQPEVTLDETLFRAYDIRGIVGDTLTRDAARHIGRAVGSEAQDRDCREVAVARDGRDTGPELIQALVEGILTTGCNVVDIGAEPTPVLYYATHQLRTGAGVMVTGSHNPPEYNGFKIVLGGETLSGDAISDLRKRVVEGRLRKGEGQERRESVRDEYIERIAGDIQLQKPLKVVVDAGNGIAGDVAPALMKAIGAEVVPLYCDVDGSFPNHHPDPSVLENLEDLVAKVRETGADLGFAYDGDGDRLGVVTASGQNIYPDRLMMLFARDVLARNPGAGIIFDVKCSARLADQIVENGGSPIMWKTGHSLIKAKLKETGAQLAGEMSGHFFFTERWYGFDDGLYAGCRLLEVLAAEDASPTEILESLPTGVSTPELKVHMAEGEHFRFLESFREQARFDDAHITTTDGLRADFQDGWGLVRCSNTTPCLVLRFEGDDERALQRVQGAFRRQLLAVNPELQLPF